MVADNTVDGTVNGMGMGRGLEQGLGQNKNKKHSSIRRIRTRKGRKNGDGVGV